MLATIECAACEGTGRVTYDEDVWIYSGPNEGHSTIARISPCGECVAGQVDLDADECDAADARCDAQRDDALTGGAL